MKTLLRFRNVGGRDLYADLYCECPSELNHSPEIKHLFKHKIVLTGYDDTNFFDNVNSEPKELVCKCGRKRLIQWTREGVEVEDAS